MIAQIRGQSNFSFMETESKVIKYKCKVSEIVFSSATFPLSITSGVGTTQFCSENAWKASCLYFVVQNSGVYHIKSDAMQVPHKLGANFQKVDALPLIKDLSPL